jgi:hypothetical protein
MDSPSKILEFIQRNDLGYILGNAVRAIIYAKDATLTEEKQLQYLKDARLFLNTEIKRLSKLKGLTEKDIQENEMRREKS